MPDIKILDTRKLQARDPARAGKEDIFVLYSIDGQKTASVRVPAEGFTADKLKEAIKKDMQEHHALTGQTFKL